MRIKVRTARAHLSFKTRQQNSAARLSSVFLEVFAGATAATPSRTLHSWKKIKKTSVTTTASSLAKVVLPKVSAAAHRSRHPEPVSCSSCCAVWCLRLPADLQAASPVPQARLSSQCCPADGACTSVVAPPILTLWRGSGADVCSMASVWMLWREAHAAVLAAPLAQCSAAMCTPHRFCDHRSSHVDSMCHQAALGTRL